VAATHHEGAPVTDPVRVLLISGSLRENSTNTALLRLAGLAAPPDIATELYEGMGGLPYFNPDADQPPFDPAVVELRAMIHSSDAILFSTPEYAGGLPGSFKNLLDWTIGDEHADSIYRKPVAWVNTSAAPKGAADAHESLRIVLGYAHARVVDEACSAIPVARQAVHDGLLDDREVRVSVVATLRTLAEACS
jgi:chromate reductase, NAD(P)H dehydrogenase (quinone)